VQGGSRSTIKYRVVLRADRIIAISASTQSAIESIHPQSASRCVVIAHGVDEVFQPARTDALRTESEQTRALYAPGARRHVLIVGQAVPYKNHHRAVEAFLGAFRDCPDVHLIVVQRLGSNPNGVLALARSAGAAARVHVHGAIPRQDLIGLYRSAVCLCHPSLDEGWGMPISEALACGCPVVTSRRSAMLEVGADAAIYVDPESVESIAAGIHLVAENPTVRNAAVSAGLSRARELSWDRHASQTANVYREVLSARRALRSGTVKPARSLGARGMSVDG
jgi:glycosyltransferase involved in cell wall biosynthesis